MVSGFTSLLPPISLLLQEERKNVTDPTRSRNNDDLSERFINNFLLILFTWSKFVKEKVIERAA